MNKFLRTYWLILLMAASKLAIQLLAPNHRWDLQRDEYLYLAEGNHLAWGYLEVPPTMAVLALICKWLGESLLVIRLIPALIGTATILFTGRIAKDLGGGLLAQFLAMAAFLFSGYLRMDMLFQPNALEVLYFTWCAWYLIRYIQRPDHRYLIYIGIILGLGLMNKYSMGLFIIGLFAGMILTPYRKLIRNKYTWISLGIALVIFIPNIIWQIIHRFPVVHHMEELSRTQLIHVSASSFLMDQGLNCLAGLPVWLAGLAFYLFSQRGKPFRILGWMYLTIIVFLLVTHGKGYYAMVCYPMLMGAGGVYITRLSSSPALRFTLRPALVLWIFVLGIRILPLLIPTLTPSKMVQFCKPFRTLGLLRWEDGTIHPLPQDYADMLGWKELGLKVVRTFSSLDSTNQARTVILCDDYGQSGSLEYYGRQDHLPPVEGKEASFQLWIPRSQYIHNLLLVTDNPADLHNPILTRNFKKIVLAGSITNPFSREEGDLILMCYGANADFNRLFHAWNQAVRARFE